MDCNYKHPCGDCPADQWMKCSEAKRKEHLLLLRVDEDLLETVPDNLVWRVLGEG